MTRVWVLIIQRGWWMRRETLVEAAGIWITNKEALRRGTNNRGLRQLLWGIGIILIIGVRVGREMRELERGHLRRLGRRIIGERRVLNRTLFKIVQEAMRRKRMGRANKGILRLKQYLQTILAATAETLSNPTPARTLLNPTPSSHPPSPSPNLSTTTKNLNQTTKVQILTRSNWLWPHKRRSTQGSNNSPSMKTAWITWAGTVSRGTSLPRNQSSVDQRTANSSKQQGKARTSKYWKDPRQHRIMRTSNSWDIDRSHPSIIMYLWQVIIRMRTRKWMQGMMMIIILKIHKPNSMSPSIYMKARNSHLIRIKDSLRNNYSLMIKRTLYYSLVRNPHQSRRVSLKSYQTYHQTMRESISPS